MTSELIASYFNHLSEKQKEQFAQLDELYRHWNSQINVISRKDIDSLYLHHILHSLSIAKVISFLPGEKVLDVGTGGGFPGIPLAILFPETKFYLVDSIGKKIKVVQGVSEAIGLKNLQASHARAEQIDDKFDFIVSRAVTQLKEFYPWVKGKFTKSASNTYPSGVFYLKGGDLKQEFAESKLRNIKQIPLSDYFKEEFFDTKYVIYFPAQ
ncbi:16S rRNA (guanine(527)-N(7))-methyltransferase RsmG [Pedobacter sp. HMF7647]|uniref:Ribosomal RNA small subunit methyltransferase G n=1 Tax=Hufsiella arboris TaxID=2695275 RepID=A0A7K1YES3_9SPHI|nr:16S rRNA (guanine(527)-N(7))-methyltransferase RsmG [Hufsiella arboris]